MELFYIQLPCVSRPVSESGSPTEAGPLTATGMGWVAPAGVTAWATHRTPWVLRASSSADNPLRPRTQGR